MRRRLTRPARHDIAAILDWSDRRFGANGRARYERLIDGGLRAITSAVPPVSSREAGDAAPGVRLYHLRHVRIGPGNVPVMRPRHLIAYRIVEPDLVVVVRILHDAMDLPAHLTQIDKH